MRYGFCLPHHRPYAARRGEAAEEWLAAFERLTSEVLPRPPR